MSEIEKLMAELKTANADRNDLVDRLCAVAGEYASLARSTGEAISNLIDENKRLIHERDKARRDFNAIFELTITDVMASYDPEQIVHHVSILRKERDEALAKFESEGRK